MNDLKLFLLISCGGLFLSLAPAQASSPLLQLAAQEQPLLDWEAQRLQAFLTDIEQRIPSAMRDLLPSKVVLDFVDYAQDSSQLRMRLPTCKGGQTLNQQVDAQIQEPQQRSEGPSFWNILDRFRGMSRISINRLFLQEIYSGPEQARSYPCGHQNLYRLAQASVIHELAKLLADKLAIQDNQRFIHLNRFSLFFGFTQFKDQKTPQSPDGYDLDSVEAGLCHSFRILFAGFGVSVPTSGALSIL